jgi:hypothetical protein
MGTEFDPFRYDEAAPAAGPYSGFLDGLVWAKTTPSQSVPRLIVLVSLDDGRAIRFSVYPGWTSPTLGRVTRYGGFRDLEPGDRVVIGFERGLKKGWRPILLHPEPHPEPVPPDQVVRFEDDYTQVAFVFHPKGANMSHDELSLAMRRGVGGRRKLTEVFLVLDPVSNESGFVYVRQIVTDQLGQVTLAPEIDPTPARLFSEVDDEEGPGPA